MRTVAAGRCIYLILFVVCVIFPHDFATARETYGQFMRRMQAAENGSLRFRPDLEGYLGALANRYRASQGVGSLRLDQSNLSAARTQAMDMALNDFVGHTSSTGLGFDSRMRAAHPETLYLPPMAENAARASSSKTPPDKAKAEGLMKQWINSPPHRRALRSRDYISLTTAVVQKGNKLYSIEIFSGPEVRTNVKKEARTMPDLY